MRLVHLNLPEDLSLALHEIAKKKGNSFSSEIRERLFASFAPGEIEQPVRRLKALRPSCEEQ